MDEQSAQIGDLIFKNQWTTEEEKKKEIDPHRRPVGGTLKHDDGLWMVEVEFISTDAQPREHINLMQIAELAKTIEEHGIQEPLLLRYDPLFPDRNRYKVIAGERRLHAAIQAGLKEVPCLIKDLSHKAAYEKSLIENLQRVDLTNLEYGRGIRHIMKEQNYSWSRVAARLGKETAWCRKRVELANAIDVRPDLEELGQTEDGMSAAIELAKIESTRQRNELKEQYMNRQTSVRHIEQIRKAQEPPAEPKPNDTPSVPFVPQRGTQTPRNEDSTPVPVVLTPFERGQVFLSHMRQAAAALEAARDTRQGHVLDPVLLKEVADAHAAVECVVSELKEIDRAERVTLMESTG